MPSIIGPRFVYGDAESPTELTLALPATTVLPSERIVGGDIEADSGARAAYLVRADELLSFVLRIYESEWEAVQAWLDWAIEGQPFTWYEFADDAEGLDVTLDAPVVNTGYAADPDSSYPSMLLLPVTVTAAVLEPALDDDEGES